MNSIIWKGVRSTDIEGLLICELPPITKPEMRTSQTEIDGKDGAIIEELGYSPYTKPLKIGLRGNFNIDKVIKYFTGEGEIVFSNEPDKVYHAHISDQIDYTRLLRYRQATIKFTVQPYKYKKNDYFIDTKTATVSGTSIVVTDSAEANLKALKIYGKSTQNGTPTPTAPINIVSVGDDGKVSVNVSGKNLVGLEDGGYVNSSGNAQPLTSYQRTTKFHFPRGCKICWSDSNGTTPTDVLQWKENGEYIGFYSFKEGGFDAVSADAYWVAFNYYLGNRARLVWCQLELGAVATPYEDFVAPQSIAISNALKAIPVTDKTLATYTDAEGKMWCADEIDLERGVYIKRTEKFTFTSAVGVDSTGLLFHLADNIVKNKSYDNKDVICNRYEGKTLADARVSNYAVCHYGKSLYIRNKDYATLEAFKTHISSNPVVVFAELATPIETPLTAEQIAICKNLKAYEPTTTIQNDENAYMSVEYIKPFEIFNEGYENSKPLMVLKGSGTVEVSVNGQYAFAYTFPEGENEVYIDSEKEDAYLGKALKNRNMNGEFPILTPATNKISWMGDIESISILPRSRWL